MTKLGSGEPGHGSDAQLAIFPFPIPLSLVQRSYILGQVTPPSGRLRRTLAVFFRRPSMGRKLYVGNLTYAITDSDLQQMFEAHGTVQSAQVIMDRDTGRSKGFGFVEMGS